MIFVTMQPRLINSSHQMIALQCTKNLPYQVCLTTRSWPILLHFLPIMLLISAQIINTMFNIILIITASIPQFIYNYNFILFNDCLHKHSALHKCDWGCKNRPSMYKTLPIFICSIII